MAATIYSERIEDIIDQLTAARETFAGKIPGSAIVRTAIGDMKMLKYKDSHMYRHFGYDQAIVLVRAASIEVQSALDVCLDASVAGLLESAEEACSRLVEDYQKEVAE